jgi:hypothetical protein
VPSVGDIKPILTEPAAVVPLLLSALLDEEFVDADVLLEELQAVTAMMPAARSALAYPRRGLSRWI